MNRILSFFLTAATILVTASCKFDDSRIWVELESQSKRIASLEQQCAQMNTNITSIQSILTALQNNDYVTGVTNVMQGNEVVGYTISFSKSPSITIYHGQDGADGKDGRDGTDGINGTNGVDGVTPIISVRLDTDGLYYWTLNGEWLLDASGKKVPATGPKGDKGEQGNPGAPGSPGKDGEDGQPGTPGTPGNPGSPGQPGSNGQDGRTPQLKIEDGFWFVSYDGTTWTKLGKAQGEQGLQGNPGPQGPIGVAGDSMFTGVDTSNTDYVLFTLSGGTQFKIPTWTAFETLKIQCNQMNTNITALQTVVNALQNNDYVTSVTPLMEEGKEVGYQITFSKSGTVSIYHGKDGAPGKDGTPGTPGSPGQDGVTPVIGVKADTDGLYYWTLNGEWLLDASGKKVPATGPKGDKGEQGNPGTPGSPGKDGEDGQPGTPGTPGTPGAPGQPGADGKDGRTPQLKIEDGFWFVSYDGTTWTKLGKAQGEQGPQGNPGPQGPVGVAGDSMFTGVDASNTDYVLFTLSGGTQFKIPTWYAFETLRIQCNQINTNITALQTVVNALQNNDYVTSVTPLMEEGKEVGYQISFSKSGTVSIYHGKDGAPGKDGTPGAPGSPGQDGSNGQDGITPVIGVKADTDGLYYWTLNGEWLLDASGKKVPATGPKGDKGEQGNPGTPGSPGKDGEDGQDGQDGQDGTPGTPGTPGSPGQPGADGKDGVTPQLRINSSTNFWEVSYDSGRTWNSLGIKATGERGPQGEQGQTGQTGPAGSAGDSFFSSVSVNSSNATVTFVLADGSSFVLPYGENPIRFESVQPQTITSTSKSVVVLISGNVNDIVSLSAGIDAQEAVYTRSAGGWKASLSVNKTAKRATITVTPDASIKNVLLTVTAVMENGATYKISKILKAEEGTGGGTGGDPGTGGEVDPPTPPDPGTGSTNPNNANCYIVTSAGSYSFPTVKGNSDTSVGAVASAEVLWESFGTSTAPQVGDLISNVRYSNGRITYTASNKKGNAVIAAKNSAGTILWSWHIWLTDQPADQVYNNNAGAMMDRNLGATSATPGAVSALGLFYQWGRKDPFLGSASISGNNPKAVSTNSSSWAADNSNSTNGTIEYALANPTVFIKNNSFNSDWYYTGSSTTDNTRWQSSKTIYDPCPPGYRVPDGGFTGVWSKAFGSSSSFSQDTFDSSNRGVNFGSASPNDGFKYLFSSTCWYPAAGYLISSSGALSGVGINGYYWSCTPDSYYACDLYFYNNGNVYPSNYNYRASGRSVRCLQE